MLEYTIRELGYDAFLERGGEASLEGASFSTGSPIDSFADSSTTASYNGGIADYLDNVTAPQSLQSGTLMATLQQTGILYSGKTGFTDFTNNGYMMGIDSSTGTFKFVMGVTGSSLDWNVTTANTLTLSGNLAAGSIDIGGADATSFHVNTGGDMWLGNAAYASAPFKVSNAGVLYAVSGTIGGATLGTSTIVLGSGSNAITLDGSAGTITTASGTFSISGSGGASGASKISNVYTDVSISNSSTETDLVSVTIPGGTLGTGGAVRARVYLSVTAAGGGGTLTLKLKYGSTTLASAAPANFYVGSGWVECILMATGATNTQEGSLSFILTETGTGSALNQATFNDNGTAGETSTGDLTLKVTATFSSASASNTLTMRHATVEKIT